MIEETLDAIIEAGKMMLENGSEIYRAEQTMEALARDFGFEDINIFTLSTCIYVTCKKEGQTMTRIKKVKPHGTNLTIISRINQLSRDITAIGKDSHQEMISLDLFKKHLSMIDTEKKAGKLEVAIAMGLSSGVFAFMLEGCNLVSFICTCVIGFLSCYVWDFINQQPLHVLMKNILVTIFITTLAIICKEVGLNVDVNHMVIGGIMLVVPGVALTNAIRDALNGDILSGTIRTVEACTIALGIALGVGFTLMVYKYGMGWFG